MGSPLFRKATIQLGSGKTLVIEAEGTSERNIYVQSVKFNGQPLQNCWLYRDELMQGGRLVFTMGDEPNEHWGTETPPPSAP